MEKSKIKLSTYIGKIAVLIVGVLVGQEGIAETSCPGAATVTEEFHAKKTWESFIEYAKSNWGMSHANIDDSDNVPHEKRVLGNVIGKHHIKDRLYDRDNSDSTRKQISWQVKKQYKQSEENASECLYISTDQNGEPNGLELQIILNREQTPNE